MAIYNCPNIRRMINKHPRMMAKVLHKLEPNQKFSYWHKLCKVRDVEAISVLVYALIRVGREL